MYFFNNLSLPEGFKYPQDYVEFVDGDRKSLRPWWLIGSNPEFATLAIKMLNEETGSTKYLVPFAKTDDGNDFACFDGDDSLGNPRIYFYTGEEDMSNVDWEKRYYIPDFSAWLEMVREEQVKNEWV